MRDAHKSQNSVLQKLQQKAVRLGKMEEACRTQERLIERLEAAVAAGRAAGRGVGEWG